MVLVWGARVYYGFGLILLDILFFNAPFCSEKFNTTYSIRIGSFPAKIRVIQFSRLRYFRTQLCNWPVARSDIGNIICWLGWSIDTYIGTVGTLLFFLVPCSLLSLLAHERRALCDPSFLSCLVILLSCHQPRWDSNRGLAHCHSKLCNWLFKVRNGR